MTRIIRCECGFEVVSDSDEELITLARAHAMDAHGTELPPELLLSLASPVEPRVRRGTGASG